MLSWVRVWLESTEDALVPVEVPLTVKDRVVPLPVEGFGKATALVTFRAATDDAGSWPHTLVPERYPVTWASSTKLVLAAKLQSLDWVMLLQSLLLKRLWTWIAWPGCSTKLPVKL